jgi:hypothetical protein
MDAYEAYLWEIALAIQSGTKFSEEFFDALYEMYDAEGDTLIGSLVEMNSLISTATVSADAFFNSTTPGPAEGINGGLDVVAGKISNLNDEMNEFNNARQELFFGGQYGNVTGSLYRQVVEQGVGTLYHKSEVIMSNNFHGFFNEQEAANRIIEILNNYFANRI